ncbi:Tetratricopeptide repeat-domain-containing protein, partial [Thelonectria olida]
FKKVLSKEHPSVLAIMNNLAVLLNSLGKYEAAEKMHRQTLELREKLFGKEHPSTLDSMNNLAVILDRLGKSEEAERMYRQTLVLREKVLSKEHPSTLDSSASNKAKQNKIDHYFVLF